MIKRMQDSQMEALRSSLSPLLKGIREDFSLGQTEEFKKLLETIEKEAEELPEYVNKIHSYFAKRGLFISFYSASIHSFKLYAELIDEEEHELIEEKIRSYVENKIPEIESSLKKEFPERHRIIKAVLEAHSDKNYILSIPTLLAQADGMFSDLLEKTFYSNDEKELEDIRRRLLKKLAENGHPHNTSSLGFLLVKQLQEKSIIHEDFNDFKKNKNDFESEPLNRNYILHGKTLNYDTKVNSLKTIALVGLLCDCKKTFTM